MRKLDLPVSKNRLFAFLLFAFTTGLTTTTQAQTPAHSGFVVEQAFPGVSFTLPLQIVFFPPPDTRKLVVQKDGVVWLLTGSGTRLPTPFADLRQKVLSATDRGLLSVALDPDFPSTRWVYFLYDMDPDSNGNDNNTKGFSRVERYQASTNDPNVIDPLTQHILLGQTWSTGVLATEDGHNSGAMKFGTDKTLFVSFGDGAHSGGDDPNFIDAGGQDATAFGPGKTDPAEDIGAFRCQSLNSMNGKVLRLDKETGEGLSSNPFWDGNPLSDRSRIWVYGLRNPYRMTVRPGSGSNNPAMGDPGTLYIGDVPTDFYEEIDVAPQGGINFGWPCKEGPNTFDKSYATVTSTYTGNTNVLCNAPLNEENPSPKTGATMYWHHTNTSLSYPPGVTGKCATAGTFYTGTSYPPRFQGAFFFADYVSGWIRSIRADASDDLIASSDSLFVSGAGGVVSIEADPNTGDLYYVNINAARINRIRYTIGNANPILNASVNPTQGSVPLNISVQASGSTDPDGDPLSYIWSFGNGDSSRRADTTYRYTTPGSYTVTIAISDGRGGTAFQSFQVFAGTTPPTANIESPPDGRLFSQSETIPLAATETDTSQGAVEYRWDIDLGHADHVHPSQAVLFGRTNTYVAHTDNDGQRYYWRIRLGVTQNSVTVSDTVKIWPKMNVFATNLQFNPVSPTAGSTFSVSALVKSVGEVSSSEGFFQIREGNTVLATSILPPITDGDSLLVTQVLGPLSQGNHTLTLRLDPTDTLFETNETDNEISGIVNIQSSPNDLWIYREGLTTPWINASWGGTSTLTSTEQAFGGTRSAKFVSNAWGALRVRSGPWGSPTNIQPGSYSGIEFYLYSITTGLRLAISLHNDQGGSFPVILYNTIPTNQWIRIQYPMSQINPNNLVIHDITIQNNTNSAKTFYVDDVRFVGTGGSPPPPSSITVQSPNGGENWPVGSNQNITWTASNVSTVNLHYRTAPSGSWTLIASSVNAAAGNYAWIIPNTPTTQARVRIESAASTSINDSSNALFTISSPPSPPPLAPTLVSPANGSINQSTTLTLSWSGSSGATNYRVQLAADSLFAVLRLDDSTLSTTSRQVTSLDSGSTYFWRVNARNQHGTSGWSSTWNFRTIPSHIPPPTIQPAVLRDDFNAANGTLAGRLKWQIIQNNPNGGSMSISSNAIQPTSTGGNGTYGGIVWDTLMSAGTEAGVTILQKSNNYSWPMLLIYGRMNNKDFSTGTGYRLRVTNNTGTDYIEINRIGPGYANDVLLTRVSREVNVGDTVTFRILNDNRTMAGLVNGISVIQFTDTVYRPTQWYFALRAQLAATPARFDDFKVSSQTSTSGTVMKSTTGEHRQKPVAFELAQNYPNPFNPTTTIFYSLPEDASVRLRLYDFLGQEIMTLLDGFQHAGVWSVRWNGKNSSGFDVPSGVYLYRLDAVEINSPSIQYSRIRKMLLLR